MSPSALASTNDRASVARARSGSCAVEAYLHASGRHGEAIQRPWSGHRSGGADRINSCGEDGYLCGGGVEVQSGVYAESSSATPLLRSRALKRRAISGGHSPQSRATG